jgi:hypothetical protein
MCGIDADMAYGVCLVEKASYVLTWAWRLELEAGDFGMIS